MKIVFTDPFVFFFNRLLSASLHSGEVDSWVKVIDSRDVLQRVMWIAANTMNLQLLEKVFICVAAALKRVIHCSLMLSKLFWKSLHLISRS